MRTPTYAHLEEMRANGAQCESYAMGMHPNPRFYKYHWWVFSKDSEVEGQDFLSRKYRMSTATAMGLIERLRQEHEPFLVYNDKFPRVGGPFDPTSARWKSAEWATRYEDDEDDAWNGHK